jgi:hypothetical protein
MAFIRRDHYWNLPRSLNNKATSEDFGPVNRACGLPVTDIQLPSIARSLGKGTALQKFRVGAAVEYAVALRDKTNCHMYNVLVTIRCAPSLIITT